MIVPSLLNGHECKIEFKICNPLPVMVTPPYLFSKKFSNGVKTPKETNHSIHITLISDPVHCNGNPCKNGTCNDTASPFFCQCKPGFTGTLCDQGTVLKYFQHRNVK